MYDPNAGRSMQSGRNPGFGSTQFQNNAALGEPLARFPAPGQEHGDEITTRPASETSLAAKSNDRFHKRELARRTERDGIVKAFDTADDLSKLEKVDHTHLEQAVKDLKPAEITKAVKQLVADEKVTAKDASIAVRDLEHTSDIDEDAIDALRQEFNIEKPQSTPKKGGKRK